MEIFDVVDEDGKFITIEALRKQGYSVFVRHYRVYEPDVSRTLSFTTHGRTVECFARKPARNGGYTSVRVALPKIPQPGGYVSHFSIGHADCSKHDTFNRQIGTQIALARALALFGMLNCHRMEEEAKTRLQRKTEERRQIGEIRRKLHVKWEQAEHCEQGTAHASP